jgi:hypothetical protein
MTATPPKGAANELLFVMQSPAVGKYDVVMKSGSAPAAGTMWAQYSSFKDCKGSGGGFATGKIELTRVDATHIAGNYDLKFATGFLLADGTLGAGETKGDFDALACNAGGLTSATICQ